MGFGWFQRLLSMMRPGTPRRPHRPTATEKLKARVRAMESQYREVATDRDEAKAKVGQLERQVANLEDTKHEQAIEIRKLEGSLSVEEEQVRRQAEVLVYYETVVKAATARASVEIAKATQGRGGLSDAQFFGSRD